MENIKITLPVKKDEFYLHFDIANNIDYIFEHLYNYDYHSGLKSFKQVSSRAPSFYVFPAYNSNTPLPHDEFLRKRHIAEGEFFALNGFMKGVKSATIVIPGSASLKLSNSCFEPHAHINLILSKHRRLYKVEKTDFASGKTRTWYLIADKNFECNIQNREFKLAAKRVQSLVTKNNACISVSKNFYYDAKTRSIAMKTQEEQAS